MRLFKKQEVKEERKCPGDRCTNACHPYQVAKEQVAAIEGFDFPSFLRRVELPEMSEVGHLRFCQFITAWLMNMREVPSDDTLLNAAKVIAFSHVRS